MRFLPAIDVLGGEVVRLRRGDPATKVVYDADPRARAEAFREAGAHWVHVVDLSAALGQTSEARAANLAAIEAICAVEGLSVDVGGGVRTLADVERLLSLGCAQVALGTPLVDDPDLVTRALRCHGAAMVADVAAVGEAVRVAGWQRSGGVALDDLLARLGPWGFSHLVFTDIARDGTGSGVDVARYARVARRVGFPVVASGGVHGLADVRALAALGDDVIEGVIAGRAIYEGELDVAEAVAVLEGGGRCSASA